MILTDTHVEYIIANLEFYGLADGDLKDDFVDHICTYVENSTAADFNEAYKEAIQQFGGQYAFTFLQRETSYMVTFKKDSFRKKMVYISALVSAFLISTGFVFKLMHWPFAGMLLLAGFVALNIIFMPLFFYHRYKRYSNGPLPI